MILTLRTDKPQAEIGLFDGQKRLVYDKWEAHRQLAETLHRQIANNLQFVSKDWADIEGIVVFKGPGSFTGLRIGLSVANALAYSLKIPIAATTGENWKDDGLKRLRSGDGDKMSTPNYGSPAHITRPVH